MANVKIELNKDSAAWRNVFLNNGEIRAALMKGGQELANAQSAKTGEDWESDIRILRNTQVARIRPIYERLSDEEVQKRRATAAHKGRKKYWRNKRKNG